MKIIAEVSRRHYHPGPDFPLPLTKKRDLSQPGQWVANERIDHDGKSYAIVMPPREVEHWEDEQPPHIHLDKDSAAELKVSNGDSLAGVIHSVLVKFVVKVGDFVPRAHFDEVDAKLLNVVSGDEVDIIRGTFWEPT